MSQQEKLKKMIEAMVRKEVRAIAPQIIKETMAQVMGELIMESTATLPENGNSHKRRALTEASYMNSAELDEYPNIPVRMAPQVRPQLDRNAMAARRGYGEFVGQHGGEAIAPNGKEMIVSSKVTEHGTPIPVDPTELPDHVIHALTRDYRDVMAILNKKNG